MALTQEQLNRILGKESVVQRAFAENRPTVTNTPRSIVSGTYADLLKPLTNNLVGDIVLGDVQRGLESASYNQPLTTGGSLQTGGFRPEYLALALGLTPMGKGKKAAESFSELASSGKLVQAKNRTQEIDDLVKGKSKFAEVKLNWDDPKSYDLANKLEKQGFMSTVIDQGRDQVTLFHKKPEDIASIVNAKTPYDYGKAYGYSEADVANFYKQRYGKEAEQYFQQDKQFSPQTIQNAELPLSKNEVIKSTSKMSAAEAKAAGYWHPVGDNKKLKMPVSEMTSVVTPMENVTTPKIITPEDLYGGVGIVAKGDRSGIGLLHEINGQKLYEPVPLEGGFRYMDYQDPYNSVWASNQGRVTDYKNKIEPIVKQNKDAYLISTTASHGATDFNAMMTDALFEQMKNSKIANKSLKDFDATLKERRPEWVGINSPDAINQLNKTGALRHAFHDIVQLDKFQKSGFPDIASTRKAITDPNLLDVPNGYSGYRIGRVDPNNIILPNPQIPHTTYDTAMGGNLVGTSGVQLPVENWFPDFINNRRINNRPISGDAYAIEQAKPTQEFNQQWLDQIMPVYEKALKNGLL
jgi:hypothetical protein